MGYSYIASTFTSLDTSYPFASVAPTTTVTIDSFTGEAFVILVTKGDGANQVEMSYSVDGGVDIIYALSNQKAIVPVIYTTSLVLKAHNTLGIAKNRSSVSLTGVTF